MNTNRGSGFVEGNSETSIFGPSSDGPSPAKNKRFGASEDSPTFTENRAHGSFGCLEVSDLPVRQVRQSYKNRKIEKLKQEGRKIEYIAVRSPTGCGNTGKTEIPAIPAYYSHEATCNLNGKAVRTINREVETIWCRHLAYSYVKGVFGRGKASFEAIGSINKLENFEGIADEQLLGRIFYRKCPADAYYFTPERFPEALAKIARQHSPLPDKTEKSYLFSTTNHQMALRIKKRGDALKIIFYDPNDTLRHKSFILSQPDDVNALSIDNFLSPADKAIIFPEKSGSGCFMSVETSIKRDDSNVYHFGLNETLFHLLLKWGHYGHKNLPQIPSVSCNRLTPPEKLKWFQAYRTGGTPGLFMALQNGHADAIKAFADAVKGDNGLSQDEKFTLLQACSAEGTPGLFMAFQYGHSEAIKVFVDAIMSDNGLSLEGKFTLLQACRTDGVPGLLVALQNGHTDAVKVFVDTIKGDNSLSLEGKFTLLQACSPSGAPGLSLAFYNGQADVIKAFIDTIMSDNDLSPEDKFKLLQACSADGRPGLFIALQNGHADAVKAFADTIKDDNGLSQKDKFKLLQACGQDGIPGLFMALQEGRTDAIKAFIDTIMSDNDLSSEDKVTLLQACSPSGAPGLFMALQNGHSCAVKVFIDIIKGDNGLSPENKFTLFQARRDDGTPGLYLALQQGHADAVKAFVDAIMSGNDLSQDETFTLLQACSDDHAPGLLMALQNGHADAVVKVLIVGHAPSHISPPLTQVRPF